MPAYHVPLVAASLAVMAMLHMSFPANGHPRTFDDLVQTLRTGTPADKVRAVASLVNSRDQRAVPYFKQALRDPDARVRQAAEQGMWALWHLSGDDAADGLLQSGIRLMEERRLEEAVRAFTTSIERDPTFAEGYNKRATVLYLMQQFDKSIRDCEATLRLNPDHFGALSGTGLCYVGLKRYHDALTYFRRAVAVNPNLGSIKEYIEEIEAYLRKRSL